MDVPTFRRFLYPNKDLRKGLSVLENLAKVAFEGSRTLARSISQKYSPYHTADGEMRTVGEGK